MDAVASTSTAGTSAAGTSAAAAESIDLSARPLMILLRGCADMVNIRRSIRLRLTKTKAKNILTEEFDMDISKLHKVQLDMYINVVINFLKKWSEWKKFDRTVSLIERKRYKIDFTSYLDSKYASLKGYLNRILVQAEPLALKMVKKYELEKALKVKTEESGPDDVVMETRCTRAQLNKLVVNHPVQNTVFNHTAGNTPSQTMVRAIEGLLNWHKVEMVINLPKFSYKRHINHDIKHIFVNKKLPQTEIVELNTCLKKKGIYGKVAAAQVETLLKMVMILAEREIKKNKPSALKEILILFYKVMKQDLSHAPSELQVPSTYRRYMNKYPYVRYLYTDIAEEDPEQEQLQETISPLYEFCLIKADTNMLEAKMSAKTLAELYDRIFVKCVECDMVFHCNELYQFQCHMMEKHKKHEPALQCTNCNKVFTVNELGVLYWHHQC